MRKRYALLVFPIALIAVTTMSVTGQEEPLPAVTPRLAASASAPAAAPIRYIALAVEPVRALATPTLAESARRHDYVTFHALYTEAKAAGENIAAFDALHELWTWSMSDPIGAFYGAEMHARLSRAYPGFASYIDDHRIIDSRGAVFYPTSETRTFLLERAVEGRSPRVLIAESRRSSETTGSRTVASEARTTNSASRATRDVPTTPAQDAPRAANATSARTAPASTARVTSTPAAPKTTTPSRASSPVVSAPVTRTPLVAPATPEVATTDAASVAVAPVTVASTAVASTDAPSAEVAQTNVTQTTAAQPAARTAEPLASPQGSQPIAREGGFANRGILLLVIGIVGIGLLAVMLRTPQETTMPSILQPPTVPPAEKPAAKTTTDATTPGAPVEPLRRPAKGGAKRAS